MNLNYKILWIDDDSDFFESQERMFDRLKTYIENEGFHFEIDAIHSPDSIRIDLLNGKYDLLVVDYHLTEDGQNGDDLIRSIQDHRVLTEIIFYSGQAADQLRTYAAEKKLDGIFFSSKDEDALYAKIESVFDQTVRKVLDVDNMRGIVMAGVADLDHKLETLLRTLHIKLDATEKLAHQKKLMCKMIPKATNVSRLVNEDSHELFDELRRVLKGIQKLEPKDFDSLILSRSFDSIKRVEAVESFFDQPEFAEFKAILIELKGVLSWRNALAHQQPTIKNDMQYFNPTGENLEPFDTDKRKELRRLLRDHATHITIVQSAVKP